jgi:hypothetical protein
MSKRRYRVHRGDGRAWYVWRKTAKDNIWFYACICSSEHMARKIARALNRESE